MRRSGLCCVRLIAFAVLLMILILSMWSPSGHQYSNFKQITRNVRNFNRSDQFSQLYHESISWEDEIACKVEMSRKGPGEQGKPVLLSFDENEVKRAYNLYGYNTLTSLQISLNRSVPDIRDPKCRTTKYLKRLPPVSVIIPFHNEHWSVLLRTCYAILNRSPPELIREILLVDDASTDSLLKGKLDEFIPKHFPRARILSLKQRSGLIVARLTGARVATSGTLVFLDAHVEPTYNWLPPLLEPIVLNPKTCVCPQIDVIDYRTFEYYASDDGARGLFDWYLSYRRLPLLKEDLKIYPEPFRNPVINGGLFAIRKDFFWELGGYDDDLDIWGGEQYELSFKIWMCGGHIFDAPCSRVGHLYPSPDKDIRNPRDWDYVHRNFKRVAEVWMDEYKNYIYRRDPKIFSGIDAGNLTKQKALRHKLQCKSFKWFMETVAFDQPIRFPPIEPPDMAWGIIRSDDSNDLCLDKLGYQNNMNPVGLFRCAEDTEWPQHPQRWSLTAENDLRVKYFGECADVPSKGWNAQVFLYHCHGRGGNQRWRYDLRRKWLVHGGGRKCLEADPISKKVYVNICNARNRRMRWTFGVLNETALREANAGEPLNIAPQLKPPP